MTIRPELQLGLALLIALAGCARAPEGMDTSTTSPTAPSEPTASTPSATPSPTPGAPATTFAYSTEPIAVEPGTYRIPMSAWSVVDFAVTFPEGWTVQYGHDYLKHSDAPDEFGFYPVVVDAIYTDGCEGEGELMEVGPSVDDLAAALLRQPGPMANGPVDTTLGGYPATRIDLTVPEGFDLKVCRLEGLGLQIWYSPPADKYFVLLPDGVASVYIVDVDGQRQVFLTQHRLRPRTRTCGNCRRSSTRSTSRRRAGVHGGPDEREGGDDWPRRHLALVVMIALTACAQGTRATATSSPGTQSPIGEPSPTPTVQDIMELTDFSPLEPGTYLIDPDLDPSTPLRVVYEVPEGWSSWIGAAKFYEEGHVGVSITTVTNLVRHGCRDHSWADPPVGPSVDDLATALADLAPFRVTSPPKVVTIYGYRGKHLELTVPDLPVEEVGDDRRFAECIDGNLKSWVGAIDTEEGDAFYGYSAPGHTDEFWILDVNSTRLMIEANWSPNSPRKDLAEMRAILDSIRIEP